MKRKSGTAAVWKLAVAGLMAAAVSGCSDRPAQPGKSAEKATAAPTLTVKDWGPRETKRGQAVNKQPDGASAIWIGVSGVSADPATKVKFGDTYSSPATVTPDLVTAAVPKGVIDTAGDYPVVIEELSGRRTTVGTFRVLP
jgi:hypothetical protein